MRLDIHVHNHYDQETKLMLGMILSIVNEIKEKGGVTIMKLDELEVQVKANTVIEQSAIILIQGIAAQLTECAGDPVKIQALADELKSSAANLAAAIQANTTPA